MAPANARRAQIKVLLQLRSQGGKAPPFFSVAAEQVRASGFRSLWFGLSAGLSRHTIFSPLRLGLYEPCRNLVARDPNNPTVLARIGGASLSGGIAMALASVRGPHVARHLATVPPGGPDRRA